jgi:N-acetylglutamate synthase-like GNAT family acetyltransferase
MHGGRVTIRPAKETDSLSVYQLIGELGYPELPWDKFLETYYSILSDPSISLLVAEDRETAVIGLASIAVKPQLRLAAPLVTIDELVISERARGQGIGLELLKAAQDLARKLGARRLELQTSRARESYRRHFYLKNGFYEANSAVMRTDFDLSEVRGE